MNILYLYGLNDAKIRVSFIHVLTFIFKTNKLMKELFNKLSTLHNAGFKPSLVLIGEDKLKEVQNSPLFFSGLMGTNPEDNNLNDHFKFNINGHILEVVKVPQLGRLEVYYK